MGRHSYYDVRVAHQELTCHRSRVDMLTCFELETLVRHALSAAEGGAIIYDAGDAETPLDRIPFLDERVRQDLRRYLDARDLPCSTAGLLSAARLRGVQTYAVPFAEITRALAQSLQVPEAVTDRTLNTAAVAVSSALLTYDPGYLARALIKVFAGRTKVIEMNRQVVELTYDFVGETMPVRDFPFRQLPQETLSSACSSTVIRRWRRGSSRLA